MSFNNEIILKVEVFLKQKIIEQNFVIEPNLNKPTFFLCDKEINEKNFVKAGNYSMEEIATFDELNSQNCEMFLDNEKIPFEKYHTFTKEGIYTIKYALLNKLTKKFFLNVNIFYQWIYKILILKM